VSLLLVEGVTKRYGAQDVLRGVRFQIDPGQKVGLVGRNGGGKTTLLRLVEGLERPDDGRITLRKGARLGHVPQIPSFEPGQSARAYVEGGLAEAHELARQVSEVAERMSEVEGEALARAMREHEQLSTRLELAGGWELERRVATVMSGIGLDPELWERDASTLSGGEKSRTALARELVAGHDLLLLDEPTNHLDLDGIEWIESWVAELKGAVLIVSHDRRLLNGTVGSILDLERGELRQYPGNYAKYLELRTERYTSELRAYEQQQAGIQREEMFIRKHMGSQRTAEAKGRRKKLGHVDRLERPYHDVRRPVIPSPKAERGGELVLESKGLAGGYGDGRLFEALDLRIGRGQRIGVVGANGTGKSTLLRILAGRMAASAGAVEHGHGARCGYYDQDTSGLDETGTAYSEIRRHDGAMSDQEIRGHLARFLFRGAEVEKPVAALSGGERARLSLAVLMLESVSWLAMDEPTNHLDLAARTALEEMLGAFGGALICVSHDREFLDGLCTHVLEVGPTVELTTGNYTTWRKKKESEQADRRAAAPPSKPREPKPSKKPAATTGRVRNPYLFEKLEARIIELEEERETLLGQCADEQVFRDPARLKDTQFRIAEVEADLERANEEWANWS
jgi:ATP-binding cassette subfamily F protein 3